MIHPEDIIPETLEEWYGDIEPGVLPSAEEAKAAAFAAGTAPAFADVRDYAEACLEYHRNLGGPVLQEALAKMGWEMADFDRTSSLGEYTDTDVVWMLINGWREQISDALYISTPD